MKFNQDSITLGQRLAAPIPKFFRVIRTVGLVLGTVGTTILTAGAALPAVVRGRPCGNDSWLFGDGGCSSGGGEPNNSGLEGL
jgi:hypothetical protein